MLCTFSSIGGLFLQMLAENIVVPLSENWLMFKKCLFSGGNTHHTCLSKFSRVDWNTINTSNKESSCCSVLASKMKCVTVNFQIYEFIKTSIFLIVVIYHSDKNKFMFIKHGICGLCLCIKLISIERAGRTFTVMNKRPLVLSKCHRTHLNKWVHKPRKISLCGDETYS